MGSNSTLRSDELECFGVAQRLGKLLTTRLLVLQFQTRLDMLVPFAYEEFGSIVERLVRLVQISAENYTAAGMSSVARIDSGSFELVGRIGNAGLQTLADSTRVSELSE